MAISGFAKIPNSITDYSRSGRMGPFDLGIYTFLNLNCHWSTGVYRGTALGIAMQFDDAKLQSAIQKALIRLRSVKLINYRHGSGRRGAYDILIHDFEPTLGAWSGYRLNAWKHGERAIPDYELGAVEGVEEVVEEGRSRGGESAEELGKSGGRVAEEACTPNEPDSSDETDMPNIQTDRRTSDNTDGKMVESVSVEAQTTDPDISSSTTGGTPVPPSGIDPRTPAERLTRLMLFRFFEYGDDDVTAAFYNKILSGAEKLLSYRNFDEAKARLKFAKCSPRWMRAFKGADAPMAYLGSDGVWNALKRDLETAAPPSKAEVSTKPNSDSNLDPFAQWGQRKGQ